VRRPQLSYANVISTIALFVALGGTSYAVARNSIGTAQLKTNAVTSAKVKNGSLRTGDLAPAARIGQRGPRGPQGPAGGSPAALTADLQPEAWRPLEFSGGWADYGGGFTPASFRKDKQGQVHVRGLVTQTVPPPTHTQVIGVLPAGYRPATRMLFGSAGGNNDAFASVDVEPDGSIVWLTGSQVERNYTSLNTIAFYTD
jgi:hypothetical protein